MSNALLEPQVAVHIDGNRWMIVREGETLVTPAGEATADRFADLTARARRRAATRPDYLLEGEADEVHDTVVAVMPLQMQALADLDD